jgi:hypothetical protein
LEGDLAAALDQSEMTASPMVAVVSSTPTSPPAPSVGIFWLVNDILVFERSTLDEAEPDGDYLTHPVGHDERWEEWQRLGTMGLSALGYPAIIAITEYEDWPRGRIVYEEPMDRFVIYADERLQNPETIGLVKTAFGLGNADAIVRSDDLYR